ncbi:MAG: tRNA lysidine(34) synthetase TilS [Desulfonauticus sp.]|nr:tRNA lysidine(34) synthetase TilS [Desulfonauticus sp.]
MLKVENFLHEQGILVQNKKVLVALSGGPDSTALVIILCLLRQRLGLDVEALYLNHGLREESVDEEVFVKKLGTIWKFPVTILKTKIKLLATKTHSGIEECSRRLRYLVLKRFLIKQKCHYIALGHQLNDLAEDVLLRMLRGAGWPALGGMDAYREKEKIIRPLLFLTKQEIEQFLGLLKQNYCVDKSNFELNVLRNRVRHTILPLFCAENPSFLKNIYRLWQLSQIDKKDFNFKISLLGDVQKGRSLFLARERLDCFLPGERLRIYAYFLNQLGTGQVLSENLFKLEQCFKQKAKNKKIQFPGNKMAIVNKRGVFLLKKEKSYGNKK